MNNYNYPTIQQNTDGNNILEENYIVFSLCNKKYAINIKNVIEVMNLPVIDIPESMPEGVTGIFNYKGLMIKAIDLCPMLGFEPRNFTVNNKLIIINLDGSFLAIHTDSIINIFSFEKTNIQPIPYSAENSILKNIYKNETEQICIVDIDNLNNLLALNTKKQNNIDYLTENVFRMNSINRYFINDLFYRIYLPRGKGRQTISSVPTRPSNIWRETLSSSEDIKNLTEKLNSIKDKPYEVIDIITAEQLEQIKTMDDIIEKSRRKES